MIIEFDEFEGKKIQTAVGLLEERAKMDAAVLARQGEANALIKAFIACTGRWPYGNRTSSAQAKPVE